ncbi:hypothetical protein DVS77_16195 [Mycolicibacterium moriokaense]|nr:hypothetical protein DVS77_16195 [Mycolicibacterium moriokaense]
MTPKRVLCALAATAAVAIVGCGSGRGPQADETTTSAGGAPTPSQAFGPTYAEGVIEKKIGEPAGLNCPDDPNETCDLNFNVTAIQQGATCVGATDGPGPDQQFLRFDIDAFPSEDTFQFPDSADALLLRNWSVDGADGTVHDLVVYPVCGDGAAPISEPVASGGHARARVVVQAPKPAKKLRLSWYELVWEWPIAGAD